MGNFTTEVKGLRQLMYNLREFGSDRVQQRICKAALQYAARPISAKGKADARQLGLAYIGLVESHTSRGVHEYQRYGRIPRSITVGRAYVPKNDPNAIRVNVGARSQRRRGIFRNRAPHAHLIEYGFTDRGGRWHPGTPFLGPALDALAGEVIERMAAEMSRKIDELRFPT